MERQSTDPNTVICLSCLAENHVLESFCRTCGAPIGATTNLDPFLIIRSEGEMLRRALEGRPKFIVVLGIWMIHLPMLLLGVVAVINLLPDLKDSFDFVTLAIVTAVSYFAFIVLYKITRNYLSGPEPARGPGSGRSLKTAAT